MKKISVALTILLAASFSTHAQTVTSASVMGYTKISVPAGNFFMMANPFLNSNAEEMTLDEIFETSLPNGTTLYVYDSEYTTYDYITGIGWVDGTESAGDVVITRGQGLWIKNGSADPLNLILSGNTPGNELQTATNNLPEGFVMIASSYPATVAISDLGLNPVDGDELYIYEDGYEIYTYIAGMGGWVDTIGNPANDALINTARGFWYKTSSSRDWVEAKPYPDF